MMTRSYDDEPEIRDPRRSPGCWPEEAMIRIAITEAAYAVMDRAHCRARR
jgi:hypothetical protein